MPISLLPHYYNTLCLAFICAQKNRFEESARVEGSLQRRRASLQRAAHGLARSGGLGGGDGGRPDKRRARTGFLLV